MSLEHPYIRYAKALLLATYNLTDESTIEVNHIKEQIEVGLNHFRVCPAESFDGKEVVRYNFSKIEKGNTSVGIYLATNVITEDRSAKHTWAAANNILDDLNKEGFTKNIDVAKSVSPMAGEYLSFSFKSGISRGKPKLPIKDVALSLICTLTPYKPCMQDHGTNTCIIPDIRIESLVDFIRLFKDMLQHKSSSDLMQGVVKPDKKKGKDNVVVYKTRRPNIFNGNFPNAPRSTSLGAIALLASIGEFGKMAEYSDRAKNVLDSFKDSSFYLIKYGDATTFTYSHHIIELAKQGNLRQIVDSIYYSKIYNQGRRDYNNTEYQKFDLFSARFLQLFNKTSFQDFLAFRTEYPHQLDLLFKTYFTKMENIDIAVVKSARSLGKWLNLVAYFAAKAEIKEGSSNYFEKIREHKAKVLIELESSAFAAKTGDALIAQVITRAGRLSGMDAPPESDLFMEKTASGEINLEQAKNLVIAFSRLRNTKEAESSNEEDVQVEASEDLSNI